VFSIRFKVWWDKMFWTQHWTVGNLPILSSNIPDPFLVSLLILGKSKVKLTFKNHFKPIMFKKLDKNWTI
jgi:hypothetical protein